MKRRFLVSALLLSCLVLSAQDRRLDMGGPFYSHIFIDKIAADSKVIIPCQSVYDVQIAARLGFKVIEANAHESATPGKYIVMHGVRGRLGDQVVRRDGTSAADVVIRETPFDVLMSDFVYRSEYPKYRTHITSLEEFLLECRKYNLTPLVSHVDAKQVEFIRSVMGDDFIMYWGTREETSGPILEYWSYKSKEQILGRCRYLKAPYIYCMGNTYDFTDEELEDICREVHKLGCHIAFAGCYENPVRSEKLLSLGFDFSASGWDINEISDSNICNLAADLDFKEFKTRGKVRENVLYLADGQTITPPSVPKGEFLSGGSLHIMFKGRIHVEMGDYIHHTYESDGGRSTWISTYFMEQAPYFTLTAEGPVEVFNMTWKAAKM